MTEVSGRMRRRADNKKLTRVLFTKLSIDGYNRFVIYAKTTRAQGIIDEPTPSRFLRYIASDVVEGLPKITLLLPALLARSRVLDHFWHLTLITHDRHPILFSS
jgi:hypothetical protein